MPAASALDRWTVDTRLRNSRYCVTESFGLIIRLAKGAWAAIDPDGESNIDSSIREKATGSTDSALRPFERSGREKKIAFESSRSNKYTSATTFPRFEAEAKVTRGM